MSVKGDGGVGQCSQHIRIRFQHMEAVVLISASATSTRFPRPPRRNRVGNGSGTERPTLSSTPGVHATRKAMALSDTYQSIHVRPLCQRHPRQARRATCDASRIVTWGAAQAPGPQAPRLPAARLRPAAALGPAVPRPAKTQAPLCPDQTSPTSRDVSRTSKTLCVRSACRSLLFCWICGQWSE